jgi:GWxTD domain-containing protein
VKDLYASGEKFNHFDIIQVNVPDSEISVSDILFVESYKPTGESNMLSKNGYDMVPYIANFYPDNMKTLTFYTEIYNPGKEAQVSGNYIVKYYIENSNNKQILHDYSKFKKLNQGDLNCVFTEFNIESLASGNYSLVVEVRDKENRMLCKKDRFFQRSAPGLEIAENKIKPVSFDSSFVKSFISKDTLKEYINCLKPIADINEKQYIENQIKAGDLALMQQFFYDFWTKRNPGNPENDWQIYHEQVIMVNNLYSTKIYKGYETDRGRVYLAYGAPNNVVEAKHEPSAYPYEIWHYYQSNTPYGEQVNIKFVFYNPELIGDYTLLHSTAKGEFSDPQWERRLSKRNNTMYNHDVKDSDEAIGNRAKENFNK